MQRLTSLSAFIILSLQCFTQTQNPGILFLSAHKTHTKINVQQMNQQLKQDFMVTVKRENLDTTTADFELRSESQKRTIVSRNEFIKNITLDGYPTSFIYEHFVYSTLHYSGLGKEIALTASSKTCPDNIDSLRAISKATGNQFVVNIPEVTYAEKNGRMQTEIRVQIYDQFTDSIIFSKQVTGMDEEINEDEADDYYQPCSGDGIYCSLKDALGQLKSDIYKSISSHMRFNGFSASELRKKRTDILLDKSGTQTIDTKFLNDRVDFNEWDIDPETIFYQLFNADSTQLVFLTYSRRTEHSEEVVSIGRSFSAFSYNGKWYVENETYFNTSEDLSKTDMLGYFIRDDFFLNHSDQLNPAFWNANTFEKVERNSIKHQKEIELYKRHLADKKTTETDKEYCRFYLEEYQREDEENKPYFGMYQLVVDELKAEKGDFR